MIKCIIILIFILVIVIFHYSYKFSKSKELVNSSTKKKKVINPLIFGFAVGYNWDTIRLFVVSLRNSGFNRDIVIAVFNHSFDGIKNKFAEYNLYPILIEEEWPFFSTNNEKFKMENSFLKKCLSENRRYGYKWNIYRFSILNCWLLKYGSKYSHIFSLDIRDVVFQRNPIELQLENGLYLVEETKTNKILLKDDRCNLSWLRRYRNYKEVINNKILNSGTIYGSNKDFIDFIQQFCKFLKDNYVNTAEQGTLNYAYYSGYFKDVKIILNKNQRDIVLTTGLDLEEAKLLKIRNNCIINEDGSIPYIIHQYDRCDKFIDMYKEKNMIK